jgi:hypothetical protein
MHRPTIPVGPEHRPLIFDYKQGILKEALRRWVLTNGSRGYSFVEPRHSLQDAWGAPFSYADSRHVFFVTTAEQPVLIANLSDYGVGANPAFWQSVEIPPLVLIPEPKPGPKYWGDGGPIGPGPGVINLAPMQRFVTEGAYIRQGIGTTGGVMYGDKQIGPSGTISDGQAEL